MRRRILFLILCMGCVTASLAVNPFAEELLSRNNSLVLTPKAGVTFSTMSQDNDVNLFDGASCGFMGGIELGVRFGRITDESPAGSGMFGISVGLQYSANKVKTLGVDDKGAKSDLSLSSFDIPVSVRIYPFAKSLHLCNLYIEAGASMTLGLGCDPASLTVKGTSQNTESVTYHFKGNDKDLKANDFRPLVGVGYSIPGTGLGAGFRYYVGMSDIAGNLPCRMSSAEVSVMWQFKLCEF